MSLASGQVAFAADNITGTDAELIDLAALSSSTTELLAQSDLAQITNVQLIETETGLQVILETADSELATPTTNVSGDALIVEIP
ncbi:MAG: hypothetical protein AAF959_26750, partial [Cyanobacteria bacterium P01_D01_bin.56]